MMTKLFSALTTIPFALFLAAWVIFSLDLTPPAVLSAFGAASVINFPFILILLGMLLSWWFNRSRVFFILTALTLGQWGLTYLAAGLDSHFFHQIIYPLMSLLIPLNIMIFSLLRERGIFTVWGMFPLGGIAVQALFATMLILTRDPDLMLPVSQPFLPAALIPATPLPQTALAALALAQLVVFVRLGSRPSHVDQAFFSLIPALAAALHFRESPSSALIFFTCAALMLIIAVIQDSYSMAYLDELTGLPARRALREEMLKLSGHYVIAMLDIDFFKKFNDTYGHDVGDDVLRLVASVMKQVAGGGKAFRYGGEEFTVVFPGKTLAESIPHLEELREKIAKTPYTSRPKNSKKKSAGKRLFVTISIGVAEKNEKTRGSTADEIIKKADKALYRAKQKGRNCVSK